MLAKQRWIGECSDCEGHLNDGECYNPHCRPRADVPMKALAFGAIGGTILVAALFLAYWWATA